MTRAMIRLAVRTNIVLLGLVGVVYVVWAERPRGTVFGSVLLVLAAIAWRASRRLGAEPTRGR
jgi:hypothetical protein